MDSKKGQKLSKTSVAAVLAASGVLVAMPQSTHAYSFSDLNPFADYYEPIIDLANRKIATGYPDGTFKPNVAITREAAAKMLALAIDVNISNPKNPGFKDVPMSHPNYRYIAALAEAGVINGFGNNTFKPNEPITRGQMAKILTLGFKFGVSSKLNHSFKDVTDKNAFAYFIQTLYDLNITKGKSPIAFDPFNTVTRAEMATFIWRAEKADRGNPVYAVGDIVGDQMYINGVAHKVAPHLRSILNPANKNVLQGAYVEGNFSGNTIQNITKLTINASGSSSRLLALDGGYSSFAGELIINGSYVRMKNINFTGRVEVAEAPRRSLATLSTTRIASVGNVASFIDWGKPTVPKNEGFLNPIEKETLQDKPDPTKPAHLQTYKERMANMKKYVDFENSDVRHLYVTADRTFVKSNYDIDRLTLQGNVTNVELYASPNAMYIDTDYNVSVYGVHDIRYVYKNTLKNVSFKTDSTYDYYYITSGNGFTDIGSHVYITNAIIPPNKTVNDVFDDYKADNPNIGYVEDENGKAVDRDPVENTVIPDITEPKITQLDVSAGGSTADVTLTANEDGTYYYVIKKSDEKAPSISEIKTGGSKHSGNGPIVMDEQVKFTVTGLDTMAEYTIYAIVIDKADNVSAKEERDFSTIDNRPPTLNFKSIEKKPGGKRFEFTLDKISEPGEIFYLVREGKTVDQTVTVDDIINNKTGSRKVTQLDPKGELFEVREFGTAPRLNPVQPSTDYVVYAVMVDLTGNKMRVVEARTIKTDVPDLKQPFVENSAKLDFVDKDNGIFEFTVSEELDPVTAKDPKNYELSGTGIINIKDHLKQDTVHPTKVEISGKKIRLTIPAIQALVKNDTIRVTVSKNVLDLAENEFEHADRYPADQNAPRNEAYYTHMDDAEPEIKINKVTIENDRNLVEFEAPQKAGTYYYMILESGYDFRGKGITPRDFLDEFTLDNIGKTTKFGDKDRKDYTGNLLNQYGPAELGTNTKSVEIDFDRLNPFKSYSIYMVLKDRAGLVSDAIVSAPIVADAKAPLIDGLTVEALKGSNEGASFTFTADEAGKLRVIPVPKYILVTDPNTNTQSYQLNSKYFYSNGNLRPIANIQPSTSSVAQRVAFDKLSAEIGGGKTIEFSKGRNIDKSITGLKAHQEYGFYIAAEDKVGETPNFTIFQRKDATDPALPDEPNGDQMIKYVYTDGINPFISNNGVIVRQGELSNNDPRFVITFNETIMRQSDLANYNKPGQFNLADILTIKDASGTPITGDYVIDGTYGTSITNTTNSSQIVVKLANPDVTTNLTKANRTFTVEMKPDATGATVYDYKGANGFDTTKIGTYMYPVLQNNLFTHAKLVGSTNGVSSKQVEVIVEMTVELGLEQTYYYATMASTDTRVPTAKAIIDAVRSGKDSTGLIVFGKDQLASSNNISKELRLITGNLTPTDTFITNQKLYLFTIDKHDNIIWATDGTDPFIKITN